MLGPCDSNASKPEVTDLGWGITLIQKHKVIVTGKSLVEKEIRFAQQQQLSLRNILGNWYWN